jgi:spore coat protein CotF
MSPEEINHEIMSRANILKWMSEKDIFKFDDVATVLNQYYSNPQAIHERMGK